MTSVNDQNLNDTPSKKRKSVSEQELNGEPLPKVLKSVEETENAQSSSNLNLDSGNLTSNSSFSNIASSANDNANKSSTNSALSNGNENISSKLKKHVNLLTLLNPTQPESIDLTKDEADMNQTKFSFGICGICNCSMQEKASILLGCLHSFCESCILKKKHFRLLSINHDNQNNASSDSLSYPTTLGDIPDAVFENLLNLQQFLTSHQDRFAKLIVKCYLCDCNTRASVLMINQFSACVELPDNGELNNRKLCTNCDDKGYAIQYCQDCSEYLCEECANAHKRVKITKEHVLEDLVDNKDENVNVDKSKKHLRCQIHPTEELKLYCDSCAILTCRDCQLDSHRSHKHYFIEEAADGFRKLLKNYFTKIINKKKFLDQRSAILKQQLILLSNSKNKASKDIIDFHSSVQELLTTKCQAFLDKLGEVTDGRHSQLNLHRTYTDRLRTASEHCANYINFACEEQNSLALLGAKQLIREYITAVMTQKFNITPLAPSDVTFVSNEEILKTISSKLGTLNWTPIEDDLLIKNNQVSNAARNAISPSASFRSGNNTRVTQTGSGTFQYRQVLVNSTVARKKTTASVRPNNVMNSNPLRPVRPFGSSNPSVEQLKRRQSEQLRSSQPFVRVYTATPASVSNIQQQPFVTSAQGSKRSSPQQQFITPVRELIRNSSQQNFMMSVQPPARPSPPIQQLVACVQGPILTSVVSSASMPARTSPPQQTNDQTVNQAIPSSDFVVLQKPTTSSKGVFPHHTSMSTSNRNIDLNRCKPSDINFQSAPARTIPPITTSTSPTRELKPFVMRRESTEKSPPLSKPLSTLAVCKETPTVSHGTSIFKEVLTATKITELVSSLVTSEEMLTVSQGQLMFKHASTAPKITEPPSVSSNQPSTSVADIITTPTTSDNPPPSIDRGSSSSNDDGLSSTSTKNDSDTLNPPKLDDITGILKIDDIVEESSHRIPKLEVLKEPDPTSPLPSIDDSESGDDEEMSRRLSLLAKSQKVIVKPERDDDDTLKGLSDTKKQRDDKADVSDDDIFDDDDDNQKFLYDETADERTFDPNEDWCAVCNNGGDLLCCDTCPKVFHLLCHVPEIISAPLGTWQCTLCRDIDKAVDAESKLPKRKKATGLASKELKQCERLLLELYCHPQSTPFHLPVRASVQNYYKVIKEPVDLSKIKKRLLPSNFNHYETVREFLNDVQLMFTNCFRFNSEESTIGIMGKKLQKFFLERVEKDLPSQLEFIQLLMKQQKKFLEENPLDFNMLAEKDKMKTAKKVTERSKPLPYERDSVWEPNQDDEEEEEEEVNDHDLSDVDSSSNDDKSDDNDDNQSDKSKHRKNKSVVLHIK